MGHNVEIKVRLDDRPRVEAELLRLGARDMGVETQLDVFWHVPRGRLKLRLSSRDGATLIAYARNDAAKLRDSRYELARIADAEALRRALDAALEPAGEVRKTRHLYLVDQVRVHLDRVEGLGSFLELEAVVDASHDSEQCFHAAQQLLERFGIAADAHLAGAYLDLQAGGGAR
jgi:adenylate cyclase class 2